MTSLDPTIDEKAGNGAIVRLWLALAATCLAIFLALGLAYWHWKPWLIARFGEDSLLVSGAFEVVGTLLIAAPVTGLIRAISALGHNRGQIDSKGRITLQVRDGARRLHVGLCAGLFVMFTAGVIVLKDDTALRLASSAAAAFAVIGGYIVWTAKIVYDENGVTVHRFALGARSFAWPALRKVTWVDELSHYRLDFTKGRKTTISSNYAGVDVLIALAERIAEKNARTAGSGNRSTGPRART